MRIAVSQDMPDGLADIRRTWTFVDLLQAHRVLDYIEAKREKLTEREG